MTLELKNVGMIKEANVKIDGLTVIAGENDTGKSTFGKALFLLIKWTNCGLDNILEKDKHFSNDKGRFYKDGLAKQIFVKLNIIDQIVLKLDEKKIVYKEFFYETDKIKIDEDVIFIETPLIWDLYNLFNQIVNLESISKYYVEYPYFLRDLYLKLLFENKVSGININDELVSFMKGKFEKGDKGDYFFNKDNQRVELVNTATGIKQFAIFQVLSQNNWLNKDTILILDEPEVHLHPKWQLEIVKIIVELVKNGVRIVVNSHSPYMIEALKRYSEVEEIEDKTNFYLAEDGYIKKVNDSNSETLEKIFEKLSEPFDTFEEMDMERLLNE